MSVLVSSSVANFPTSCILPYTLEENALHQKFKFLNDANMKFRRVLP